MTRNWPDKNIVLRVPIARNRQSPYDLNLIWGPCIYVWNSRSPDLWTGDAGSPKLIEAECMTHIRVGTISALVRYWLVAYSTQSHCPNKYWLLINRTPTISTNIKAKYLILSLRKCIRKYLQMLAILSRPHWVNCDLVAGIVITRMDAQVMCLICESVLNWLSCLYSNVYMWCVADPT